MSNISLSFDVKNSRLVELEDPVRVELYHKFYEDTIWIATLTEGCYTVALLGPPRTFRGPNSTQAVAHTVWVRTLPEPYSGTIDFEWLALALEANFQEADDVLAIAEQYLKGAPPVFDGRMKIGGDAGYGPMGKKGRRGEGSDFNDYLGIPWGYPNERTGLDRPEARQKGCLDCSGYMRMVWGFRHHLPCSAYRSGIPLSFEKNGGRSMPRRSFEIAESAPGILLAEPSSTRPEDAVLGKPQPGDVVFFNVDPTDDTPGQGRLDHVGMYLGLDDQKLRRFIHGTKTANGPT